MPKAVEKDSMEDIIRKKRNVDFTVYENGIIRRIYQQYFRELSRVVLKI